MTDEDRKRLSNGLFASTSAFAQARDRTYPDLVIPHSAQTPLPHSQQLRKIAEHLEDAQSLLADDALEEALEELRQAWDITQDDA